MRERERSFIDNQEVTEEREMAPGENSRSRYYAQDFC